MSQIQICFSYFVSSIKSGLLAVPVFCRLNWKSTRHRKEGVQSKKWYLSHKFFYLLFSVTQSFLLGFSWRSDNITACNKKSTSNKESTSVSEITIYYLHKSIIILLLCQCALFINTSMSIVFKDVIFYLVWYYPMRWSSPICKKSSFLSFYSFLVKFSEWHREGVEQNWQSVTKLNRVKKAIMQVTFWMNPCLICYFIFILFYTERKWLLMRNLPIILPLKSKLSGKFQRFNTIDESIGMLKNS